MGVSYNTDFNIAGFVILVLCQIFLLRIHRHDNSLARRFTGCLVASMLTCILDTVTSYTIEYASNIPLWVNNLLMVFYFIMIVFAIYLVMEYVFIVLGGSRPGIKMKLAAGVPMTVYSLICASSPLTKWIYFFKEDNFNEYCYGPLHHLGYGMIAYYLLIIVIVLLHYIHQVDKRRIHFLVTYIGVIAGFLIAQLFMNEIRVAYFGFAIASLILLAGFEVPDFGLLIRDKEALEESQEQLQAEIVKEEVRTHTVHELLKTASWALYFDENGMVTNADWSSEFFNMLGYKKEDIEPEARNMIWQDSLHPEDAQRAMDQFAKGLEGSEPFNIEYRLRHSNGEYHWYHGTGEIKTDEKGRLFSFQGAIRDINDEVERRILVEEKLAAMEELEKSQAALKEALIEAEKANQAKSRFLSSMSHDIRTPMNAIIGFTDLALTNSGDEELVREYLERIQSSGNHLLSLINDILDMNRIESGRTKVEPVNCNLIRLIREVGNMVNSEIVGRKHTYTENLEKITHPNVMCDRLRLNQVLLNCLGNSIKFTPKGGKIDISLEELPSSSADRGNYVIRISDNGIGMDEDTLKRVFEPFERAKSVAVNQIQGTGLGMSITKSIVELMGGTIRIESELNKGTCYIIELPFDICSNEAEDSGDDQETIEARREAVLNRLQGMRFLVVDDNKVNRVLAQAVLSARKIIVEEAATGREAVDRLLEVGPGYYDVVLMDIQMPVMDGYEAADAIRGLENEKLRNVPVLAMTADAFEEDRAKCLQHGMNGHLSKPFKPNDLLDLLGNIWGI